MVEGGIRGVSGFKVLRERCVGFTAFLGSD